MSSPNNTTYKSYAAAARAPPAASGVGQPPPPYSPNRPSPSTIPPQPQPQHADPGRRFMNRESVVLVYTQPPEHAFAIRRARRRFFGALFWAFVIYLVAGCVLPLFLLYVIAGIDWDIGDGDVTIGF